MICKKCGKEYEGTGNYCSASCSKSRNQKIVKGVCVDCGKEIICLQSVNIKFRRCDDCFSLKRKKDSKLSAKPARSEKNIRYAKSKKDLKDLKFYELSKRTISKITKRLRLHCSCCNFFNENISLDIHHIIPQCNNGSDELDNLTYLCPNCHRLAHGGVLENFVSLESQMGEKWKDYYYAK